MKRILLFMPYGSVGGMERLALTFYNYYKSKGYVVKAVKIVRLQDDIINFGDDEYALSEKDLSQFSAASRMLFYLKIPFLLAKIIKREKFTHSISFGDMANTFSSLTFTKEYKIGSIHALKSVELSDPTFLNRIFRLSYKTCYKHLHKVVCISKTIKQDLIKNCGYKFNNLEVIYNPHNLREIQELAQIPINDPAEQALFDSETIVFLGRMSIQKAPWHLLNSFSVLLRSKPDVKLIVIGDGAKDVTEHLHQLVARLGISENVVFLGRKPNPYQYLGKANLLALSSYYEGTPNVIVEAMVLGVPVVSSNCTDSIAELMTVEASVVAKSWIETEAGLITPTFYNGELSIPKPTEISETEKIFASAMLHVLTENTNFRTRLGRFRSDLMKKFDHSLVAEEYLQPIPKKP